MKRGDIVESGHWAKYVSIEYADCRKCSRLVFMAVVRGHVARWRHNRARWAPVMHRPVPVPCEHEDEP